MAVAIMPKKFYTLLASAARTDHTTGIPGVQYNQHYRGLRLTIDISAFSGTSITFTIYAVDPISGNTVSLLASAAQTGTGTIYLHIYPGAVAVANKVANEALPYQWKLTPSGTITSVTYSVHAELIP